MDGYIGEIRTVAYNWAPADWSLCGGQSLSVQQYQALYSLLGTTFGGNGSSTFLLPNLIGRTPRGSGSYGTFNVAFGKPGGAETVALTTANLAAHNHTASVTTTGGSGSATASGTVTLPVTANGSLPFSATPTLTVNGTAKLLNGMSTAAATLPTPTANSVMAVNGLNKTYGAAGTGTLQLGPDMTVTGTATGTVSGSATGSVTGTATGNVSLPVTGSTGGDVSVAIGGTGAGAPISVMNPTLGLNFVICLVGMYPSRP